MLLFRLVSSQRQAHAEVCEGMSDTDLQSDELDYRRAPDKADKSLELYKFQVNALYVAMTRAVETLTLSRTRATRCWPCWACGWAKRTASRWRSRRRMNECRKRAGWNCRARPSRPRPSATPSLQRKPVP